jgi:hypothetical protein
VFDLTLNRSRLSAAGFKAVAEAAWPGLESFSASGVRAAFAGPHALGTAAFAAAPQLERLDLSGVELGAAGAWLLASRRLGSLTYPNASGCALGDAGLAERGARARRARARRVPAPLQARPERQRPLHAADAGGRAPLGAQAEGARGLGRARHRGLGRAARAALGGEE